MPEFESEGATVVGISADSVESHESFVRKNDLGVLLLSDTGRITIEAYGAWGKKTMYGKEVAGILRSTFLIDPNGNIGHVWRKVKVPGHVEEVILKLGELR